MGWGCRWAAVRLLTAFAVVAVLWPAGVRAAILSKVQSGTTTSTASGTTTVTIQSIDTTKSFLVFQVRSNANRPPDSIVYGRIASATTVEFVRATTTVSVPTVTIQWYVATFASGVSVQRGTFTQASTTQNVTIAAVGSLSRAFVLWSKTSSAGTSIYDYNDPVVMELTSTTNLQMRTDGVYTDAEIAWEVVEFTSAADASVQRGAVTSMTGTATSATATVSAVDVARTFVLAGYRTLSRSTTAGVGTAMIRARLTDATTITFDRQSSTPGDVTTDSAWTTGLTHTCGAGSDRLLVFAVGYENASDVGVSTVTYGGQSLTKIAGAVVGTADRVELWYLNEAGIGSASNTTFTVTWGGTAPTNPMYAAGSYANVYQTTPIAQSNTATAAAATPNPITTSATVPVHGLAVGAAIAGSNGSYTWNGGWTEATDQTAGTTTTLSTAEHLAASTGSDTASATHSGPNQQAVTIAALNPAYPDVDEITWQAVTLTDGSTVRSGSSSFTTGVSQVVEAIDPVANPNHSIAFATVQAIGGQTGGAAAYTTDDVMGEGQATLALGGSTLTLDRGSALAAANVGWSVVEFKARRVLITQ